MLAPIPRRKYASLRIRNSDEVLQQILFQRQIWPRTDLHHKHCRYKHFVTALHSTFKRTIVTVNTISCCGTLFNATFTGSRRLTQDTRFTRSSENLVAQAVTRNTVVQPSLSTRKKTTYTNGRNLNFFVVVVG